MSQSEMDEKVKAFPKGRGRAEPTAEAPAGAPVSAPAAGPATPAAPAKAKGGRRRIVVSVIALAVVLGGGWFGYDWWANGRFFVATDDAYIEGDIATISPKLGGYVAKVNVVANQVVKAGDPLVTLDDGDYTLARDSAQAALDADHLTVSRIDAQIEGAKAALQQAEAQLLSLKASEENAALAQKRAADLASSSFGSQATLDNANAALKQADAAVAAGEASVASANAAIAVYEAQRAEAEGQIKIAEIALAQAKRNLGFTVLTAPFDGVVGNLGVKEGDLVSAGSRLAALVPTHELYIEANFKETQLAQLAVGEKVSVTVDALGEKPIEGVVASLSPASGSVFSVLPAENATGNFTKVVQRVPVRIALPADALAEGNLRAGLSVTVAVDTRTAPKG